MSVVDIPACPPIDSSRKSHPIFSGEVIYTRAHESGHQAVRWVWHDQDGKRHQSRAIMKIDDQDNRRKEVLAAVVAAAVAKHIASIAFTTY